MPAPSLIAFKQGVGISRKRGTYVLVGLPLGEFPVPLFDVVANCITIRGSLAGTRGDMVEALNPYLQKDGESSSGSTPARPHED
jgi:propanol-preferring alcohol dehydrogenase